MYLNGDGTAKDQKKAMELYTKAAEQGQPVAQNNLGYIYANLLDDKVKAKYWFEKASENGYADATQALEELNNK